MKYATIAMMLAVVAADTTPAATTDAHPAATTAATTHPAATTSTTPAASSDSHPAATTSTTPAATTHPAASTSTTHPAASTSTTHPAATTSTTHPAATTSTTHPAASTSTTHPAATTSTTHPAASTSTTHPAASTSTTHPASTTSTTHPASTTSTTHPASTTSTTHPSTSTTTHPSTTTTTHPSTTTTTHPSTTAKSASTTKLVDGQTAAHAAACPTTQSTAFTHLLATANLSATSRKTFIQGIEKMITDDTADEAKAMTKLDLCYTTHGALTATAKAAAAKDKTQCLDDWNAWQDQANDVWEHACQKSWAEAHKSTKGAGATIGIIVGCVVGVCCITGGLWYFCVHKKKNAEDQFTDDLYEAFVDHETA